MAVRAHSCHSGAPCLSLWTCQLDGIVHSPGYQLVCWLMQVSIMPPLMQYGALQGCAAVPDALPDQERGCAPVPACAVVRCMLPVR